MILIINNNCDRLCQDGRWRSFAMFGSYSSCVKEYRTLGRAFNRAEYIGGRVVRIQPGDSVDASGTVIRTIPVGESHVRYEHFKLFDFLVGENHVQSTV